VLLPDPPPKTQEEKVAFRKAWDARVKVPEESLAEGVAPTTQ
jgi:hypothetical protein